VLLLFDYYVIKLHVSRVLDALYIRMEKNTQHIQELQQYWEKSEDILRSSVFKLLPNAESVNDVLQELAIIALTRQPDPPINSSEDFIRWARVRCRWLALDWIETHRVAIIDAVDSIEFATPENRLVANEIWNKLITKLPDEQLIVVRLRLQGHTATESAIKLGKPPATIRSLWRHAKQRILKELERLNNE